MKQVIHIQICKAYKAYKKGSLNLNIGDIQGSTGCHGASKTAVLKEIANEIDKLLNLNKNSLSVKAAKGRM